MILYAMKSLRRYMGNHTFNLQLTVWISTKKKEFFRKGEQKNKKKQKKLFSNTIYLWILEIFGVDVDQKMLRDYISIILKYYVEEWNIWRSSSNRLFKRLMTLINACLYTISNHPSWFFVTMSRTASLMTVGLTLKICTKKSEILSETESN